MTETTSIVGVWGKIDRARKHILDLENEIGRFAKSRPYAIGDKPHPVPQMRHTTLFIESLLPIPVEIALIIGDVVHNLRSSLDHLAWQLVLSNGETPTKKTYFPIQDPTQEFAPVSADKKMEGISLVCKQLIEEVQPRNTGDDTLWRLHMLDIADKHRLLITAQVASHSWGVNAPGGGEILWFPETVHRVGVGDEIINIPTSTYRRQKHEDFRLAIDIVFGGSEVTGGESVVGTLNQITDFTADVIKKFDKFFV
jgi:hypothetical protein